jgi:hypothetical protein
MRFRPVSAAISLVALAAALVIAPPAAAAGSDISRAIDIPDGDVSSSVVNASGDAVLTSSTPFGSFPRAGGDYLLLSTGRAQDVIGGGSDEFISTDLGVTTGADGHDLSQVSFALTPPTAATCLSFDFEFLSEEYPEYVGSAYNDIFTAELNDSEFIVEGAQVVAPNNFAYDSAGNFISINTVLGMSPVPGTRMDGATEPLVAVSPIEKNLDSGLVSVILTVQDIGDSIYDSAVLVDNFRWLYGANCERTVSPLTDSDGDGLSDDWETSGIDYDGDGVAEVDLPGLGADPRRADIFLEIDWMKKDDTCLLFFCWGGKSFEPKSAALADVVSAFAAAPYANPNGSSGITVHIDSGDSIPWTADLGTTANKTYNWSAFEGIKQANFDDLRRDVYHYVVYADHYGGGSSSGISRGIPGADLIVSDGPFGGFSRIQERGTLMHELGHNLDLKHGGIDNTTYQNDPAYKSVMNYLYQLTGIDSAARLDYSRGTPFDDWANIRFDGGSIGDLGESAPILETTDDVEITPEIAQESDVAAVPGDGVVTVLGPNVFASGRADQAVVVEVGNAGAVDTTYTVSGIVGAVPVQPVTVEVPAYSTVSADVVFDASSLPEGAAQLEVSLASALLGESIDSASATILGVDTSDSAVTDGLASDAAEARASDEPPAEGVLAIVDALADTESTPTPTPTAAPTAAPTPTATPAATATASPIPAVAGSGNGTPTSSLARSGFDPAPSAALALFLLAIGITAVIARRRRGAARPAPQGR